MSGSATHKMLIEHDPENGKWGDCFRCCLAYILRMRVADVPHFMDGGRPGEMVWQEVDVWLAARRLGLAHLPFQADPDVVLQAMAEYNSASIEYLLGGTSSRGCGHSVVARAGAIIHDPSPKNDGLVGPMENGLTWVNLVTPLKPFDMF